MRIRFGAILGAAAACCLALAPPASAAAAHRDGYVTSFDGSKIVYSFYPTPGLRPGRRAPIRPTHSLRVRRP